MIWRLIVMTFLYVVTVVGCSSSIKDYSERDDVVSITPDYTNVTIPFNIAPLNFHINEKGSAYRVEVRSVSGKPVTISSKTPVIDIPPGSWKRLLSENKGEELIFDIYVKRDGNWIRFSPVTNSIAQDEIHPYMAYRLINTQFAYSAEMKLSQRNLESFDESLIFENRSTEKGCFNCHNFSNYDPDKLSIHFRQVHSGTLIKDGDKLVKLNTKTDHTMSPFGYVAWNPNGKLIAYSVNQFNEYFNNQPHNLNEVTDQHSDLIVYNVETNTVTTSPKVSTRNRENFPTWSPDGEYLYYLSADQAFDDFASRFYSHYSLVRIRYDMENNHWGEPDTIYNAKKEGRSLTFPRISPDGKNILFCLIDYGYFSINHRESDLYLMDLETGEYHPIGINSDQNDSYHAWSQNGRWVVFSSKRYNGMYSSPWFTYFDDDGQFHKPFILPQRDPLFYETFLENYNIPEFINGKVDLNPIKVRNALYDQGIDVAFDPEVDVASLYYHQEKESPQSIPSSDNARVVQGQD